MHRIDLQQRPRLGDQGRKQQMTYAIPVSIVVRRVLPNVIEYHVTAHDPLSGERTSFYHANREATFTGPHTGNPGRQVMGGAYTLWRSDDVEMLMAFKRRYVGELRHIALEG